MEQNNDKDINDSFKEIRDTDDDLVRNIGIRRITKEVKKEVEREEKDHDMDRIINDNRPNATYDNFKSGFDKFKNFVSGNIVTILLTTSALLMGILIGKKK